MDRILMIVAVFLGLVAVYLFFSNKSYKNENTLLKTQISYKDEYILNLEKSVKKMESAINTNAKAEEQAKEFEKELNDDTNIDNLDVVPDDYILKQLRSD